MVEVVGHKLKTHHPVIEPVSDIRVGNGIFRCRDGGSRSAFLSCRDSRGDKDELEKARCSRDKCAYHPRSSIPEDWVVGAPGLEPGTRWLRDTYTGSSQVADDAGRCPSKDKNG